MGALLHIHHEKEIKEKHIFMKCKDWNNAQEEGGFYPNQLGLFNEI